MNCAADQLNIAFVSEFHVASLFGGGERRIYELSRRLVARGHKVTWICMRHAVKAEIEGVEFIQLGTTVRNPPHRSVGNFISFCLSAIWHLSRNKYDVVDAQTFSPLVSAYLGSLFSRSPLVGTVHDLGSEGGHEFHQMGRLARLMESLSLCIPASAIVTVSPASRRALLERSTHSSDRIHVVTNAVDLEEISALPETAKCRDLIFVGRLVPSKGVQDFLQLCDSLGCSGAIVGQGPQAAVLRRECAHRENIEFIGKLDEHTDVLGEISKSKVLVLPSRREGYGLVLAEAAAAGVPVVVYAVGGVADVVVDRKTGLLVASGDFDGLVSAARLALRPGSQRQMGGAAIDHIRETFCWDQSVLALEKVYSLVTRNSES